MVKHFLSIYIWWKGFRAMKAFTNVYGVKCKGLRLNPKETTSFFKQWIVIGENIMNKGVNVATKSC